jgi:hypothetical protein
MDEGPRVTVDEALGETDRADDVQLRVGNRRPPPGLEQVRASLPQIMGPHRQDRELSRGGLRPRFEALHGKPIRRDRHGNRKAQPIDRLLRERGRHGDPGGQLELRVLAAPLPFRFARRRAGDGFGPAPRLLSKQVRDRLVVREGQVPDPIEAGPRRPPKRPERGVFVSVDRGRLGRPGQQADCGIVRREDRVVRFLEQAHSNERPRRRAHPQLDRSEPSQARRSHPAHHAVS